MKKWFFGEKKHLDQEKIEQEAEDLRNLRWLMDHGTVEEYLGYAQRLNPDMTAEDRKGLTSAFFQRRAERQEQLHPKR